jgi:hypothetical protein
VKIHERELKLKYIQDTCEYLLPKAKALSSTLNALGEKMAQVSDNLVTNAAEAKAGISTGRACDIKILIDLDYFTKILQVIFEECITLQKVYKSLM